MPDTGRTLEAFADRFPTVAAMRRRHAGRRTGSAAETDGTPNRAIALEELLLLWLANVNPAFPPFEELFDDGPLAPAPRTTA